MEMIWSEDFYLRFLAIILVFASVALLILATGYYRSSKLRTSNLQTIVPGNVMTLTVAGMVLGVGIGGFVDGIVLHQLLQWHGMVSNILPPDSLDSKSVNMFWDGIFHLLTLAVTFIGIKLLHNTTRGNSPENSNRILYGSMLTGWSLLNIAEGILNHHILKLHNVRENVADPDVWNYGFLLISAVMLFAGVRISAVRHKEF